MTIYTRYMIGRFTKPFVFGLGLFSLLIFLGDTFDKMNSIVNSKASLLTILECLWLEVPYWTGRVIPMATLLATLVAISGFVQSGEWLATQSCGIETKRFWIPTLSCAFAVSLLAFVAQETIMPAAWARSQRLWREKVHPEWKWTRYENVALLGGDDQFVSAEIFFPKEGRLERPLLETMDALSIKRQLDAKQAFWDPAYGKWVFYDGVERIFIAEGVVENPFKRMVSDLEIPPLNLVPRAISPDEMTLHEALEYSRHVGRFGGSSREYEVAAMAKISYPFTNLIICALGIPIALRLRKSSGVASFCVALALSFVFLWMIEISRTLGMSGHLPPVVAAWLANASFGALALFLIRRWDL